MAAVSVKRSIVHYQVKHRSVNVVGCIFFDSYLSYFIIIIFFFSFRRRKLKRIRTPAKDTGKEIPSSKNTKNGAQNRCIFFFSVEVIYYLWQYKAFVVYKTVWSRNFKQFLAFTKNRLKCKNRHAELLVKPKKNRNA